jgi:hypothetical protein
MGDEKLELVCGGVYEHTNAAKHVAHGLMVSMVTTPDGKKTGQIHWTGFKPELITCDNADRLAQLKLVGRPASPVVAKPVPPAPRPKPPAPRTKPTVGRPKKKS